jgi:hypothetical protein
MADLIRGEVIRALQLTASSDGAAGGCLLFAKRIHVGGRALTLLGAVLGQREGDFIQAARERQQSCRLGRRRPGVKR